MVISDGFLRLKSQPSQLRHWNPPFPSLQCNVFLLTAAAWVADFDSLVSPRWVSVLQNSKDEALSNAFKMEPGGCLSLAGGLGESGLQELTEFVITEVKNMPGNRQCCDCGAPGRFKSAECS